MEKKDTRPVAVALVGPTGVGKTEISLPLAEKLNAEIISIDSMQLYRGMDIGTAKPPEEDRRKVPHHMIDILPVTAEYTVADYKRDAEAVIDEILKRGKLPMLVGGTGMYLTALRYNQSYGGVSSDPAFREEMHALAETAGGKKKLHDKLAELNPDAAARLSENDVRRVIRALEVARSPDGTAEERSEGKYRILAFGLTLPREILYPRIDRRTDTMISLGLESEVHRLLLEYPVETWGSARQAIGYKEMIEYLAGSIPKEEAIRLIQRNSRRYAKRQMTWFLRDKDIRWFDLSSYADKEDLLQALLSAIRSGLQGKGQEQGEGGTES